MTILLKKSGSGIHTEKQEVVSPTQQSWISRPITLLVRIISQRKSCAMHKKLAILYHDALASIATMKTQVLDRKLHAQNWSNLDFEGVNQKVAKYNTFREQCTQEVKDSYPEIVYLSNSNVIK